MRRKFLVLAVTLVILLAGFGGLAVMVVHGRPEAPVKEPEKEEPAAVEVAPVEIQQGRLDIEVDGVVPAGDERANILFWGGFGIFSGTESPEAAWRFLKFYTGEEGSEVWKDWAIPPVASVAEEAGLTEDPIEGVWIAELDHLVPRAYVFTPYWGETADPALRRALETVLIDPDADPAEVLATAAQEAQAALDEKLAE